MADYLGSGITSKRYNNQDFCRSCYISLQQARKANASGGTMTLRLRDHTNNMFILVSYVGELGNTVVQMNIEPEKLIRFTDLNGKIVNYEVIAVIFVVYNEHNFPYHYVAQIKTFTGQWILCNDQSVSWNISKLNNNTYYIKENLIK